MSGHEEVETEGTLFSPSSPSQSAEEGSELDGTIEIVIIASIVGGVVAVAVAGLSYYFVRQKRRRQEPSRVIPLDEEPLSKRAAGDSSSSNDDGSRATTARLPRSTTMRRSRLAWDVTEEEKPEEKKPIKSISQVLSDPRNDPYFFEESFPSTTVEEGSIIPEHIQRSLRAATSARRETRRVMIAGRWIDLPPQPVRLGVLSSAQSDEDDKTEPSSR